jgi:hypothetical protein
VLVDHERLELAPVAVRVERFIAVAQQSGNPLDLVQERELAGRVVPLPGVVAIDLGRQSGEGLDLQLGLPPTGADGKPIARPQGAHRLPEPVKPRPALGDR